MKIGISIIFLFWVWIIHGYGQEYYVQVISKEKGFGLSAISKITEDHEGVLWVGTQLGLLRFDGLLTKAFLPERDNNNSLSNEYINDVVEDKDHQLWVATRNGLNRLDAARKRITHWFNTTDDPASLPGNGILKLAPSTDSTFFILCGRSGFAEYDKPSGKVIRLNPLYRDDSLHRPYTERFIVGIYISSNHFVFVRTNNGFFRYDRKLNELVEVRDTITGFEPDETYPNYCQTREGEIWYSDRQGKLYRWLPYRYQMAFQDTLLENAFATGESMIHDFDSHHILISAPGHLLLVNKESGIVQPITLRSDQSGQPNAALLRNCLETSQGIIFFGTSQGQLFQLDPLHQQFRYKPMLVEDKAGLAMGEVGDFYEDVKHQKRYISAVMDSLIYIEDLTTGMIHTVRKKRVPSTANHWMKDDEGRLWLCDGTAVQELNTETNTLKAHKPEGEALNLFDMIEIKPGVMWVASFRSGLFRFIPEKNIFELVPYQRGWKQSQIACIALDARHQSAWIGTQDDGVFRYDIAQDTFMQYIHRSSNPFTIGGDWIRDITFDSAGYVWLAVEPIGLSRFDYRARPDSAFINLTMNDGLPSSYISGLVTDHQGQVWMTTLNGIASLDTKNLVFHTYGKRDGLPSSRFTRSSMSVTPDNLVLVGSRNGYLSFNPGFLKINQQPPHLVISDVQVLNHSRMTSQIANRFTPIRLKYNENYLTVQLSVINFTDPEHNRVRYKLEGFDDQWIERTGIAEINYTKIPPGDYELKILAANNDGVWNSQETVIPIRIRPPFWQRTWFYFLIGLLVASLIYSFYRYKLRQSIEQNKLIAEREYVKAESERQLSQLEMTALRAQMNPHFVFNCLNSINRFIVVNDNEAASEYLTKFAKLIRQVLDNSRGEKVTLEMEIDTLKLYMDMESLRFIDKFQYAITVDPGLQPAQWVIQPMLIQPYVENAIWHGLMHRKTKGDLGLHFSRMEGALAVTIQDNGVGRERAKQIKAQQVVSRKSHGLKVTAQRMALLSKKLNVRVEARIEDLYDDHHQPIGTCVHLTLPLEPLEVEFTDNITTPS